MIVETDYVIANATLYDWLKSRQSESDYDSISLFRETLLQALRGVIAGAGEKMGEPIRKALTTTLLGLLGHPDVSTVGVNQCS